jgi:putative endopeptidase
MKRLWLCAAATCALLASSSTFAADTAPAPASLAAPRMGSWGFDLSARDPAVKPGDDFFRFANGKGVDAMTIPPDRSSFGSFDALVELSNARSRAVIESPGPGAPGSEEAKIKALYASFMNENRLNTLGAASLKPELDAIKAANTREETARLMGKAAVTFYSSFFGASVQTDIKDPDHYVVGLNQAGLNLPDRDYYRTPQFAEKKQ